MQQNIFCTVSKFNKESTALDLALLSCWFMSRLYLVLHSVMMMVRAARKQQSVRISNNPKKRAGPVVMVDSLRYSVMQTKTIRPNQALK